MWHWDQGRLEYFQFGSIRKIAEFVCSHDFKNASRALLQETTGMSFSAPDTHSPWRNYSRVLKLLMLVYEQNGVSRPTKIAQYLSTPGQITSDEYFHFLVRTFTDPSPALKSWKTNSVIRYPLLFSLKYLLAKTACAHKPYASFDEICAMYAFSNFSGLEDQNSYASLLSRASFPRPPSLTQVTLSAKLERAFW